MLEPLATSLPLKELPRRSSPHCSVGRRGVSCAAPPPACWAVIHPFVNGGGIVDHVGGGIVYYRRDEKN